MPHISKRRKAFVATVDRNKTYAAAEALKLVKETATAKFDEAMRVVGSLGQILGPRGLMPNPKVGTVTPDVAGAVKNAKAGQVQFRADKSGVVQCTIGRASFTAEQLRENLAALVDALNKARPAATKGIFLRKLSVSSTMGVGVKVDPASLSAQQ